MSLQDIIERYTVKGNGRGRPPTAGPTVSTSTRAQLEAWIDQGDHCVLAATIEPSMAAVMLERNSRNRRVRANRVTKYSSAIGSGRWRLTGQPIIFSSAGKLLDGQHRLMACVETGKSFISDIRFGINPASFVSMDIGDKRSAADVLGIAGEVNTPLLAATLTLKFRHDRSETGTVSAPTVHPSPEDALAVLKAHPGLRQAVNHGYATYQSGFNLRPAILSWLYHEFSVRDAGLAARFYKALATGAGLSGDHPALTLRNKVNKMKSVAVDGYEQAAWLIKAWNKLRRNEPAAVISWNPKKERFPEIV